MSTRYVYYAIAAVVIGIMVWVVVETVNQPGIADLEGNFEEVGSYRNENNTGPVIRIYSVFVEDTVWQQMKEYGDYMPHTKYGNTKVYFFNQKEFTPTDIHPDDPEIDQNIQAHCIGLYEKSAMGEVNFTRFPFRENP